MKNGNYLQLFSLLICLCNSSCSARIYESKYYGMLINEPSYKYDYYPLFKNKLTEDQLPIRTFYYEVFYQDNLLVYATKIHQSSGVIASFKFDNKGRVVKKSQNVGKGVKEKCKYTYHDKLTEKIEECDIAEKNSWYKYHIYYKDGRKYKVVSLDKKNAIKDYAVFNYKLGIISKFDRNKNLINSISLKK